MTDEKHNDDQLERAEEEAARAAAAAEEAVEAAEKAEAAAEAVAAKPKAKRSRKAREAEVAADEAEDAAAEAVEETAKPKRARAKKAPETVDAEVDEAPKAKPKRARAKKAEPTVEEAAAAAEAAPEETGAVAEDETAEAPAAKPAPKRRRDQRREVPAGVEVRAQAKYVRTSARKARLVCEHIRGKDVAEARAILAFTPRAAAKDWAKLLESAVANAEHNHELVGDDLRIAAVYADEGPTLKRYRPRAMGRATRIRKRTSHLTITLTPKEL
jgi:ribosomal protein L22